MDIFVTVFIPITLLDYNCFIYFIYLASLQSYAMFLFDIFIFIFLCYCYS